MQSHTMVISKDKGIPSFKPTFYVFLETMTVRVTEYLLQHSTRSLDRAL